MEGSLPPTPERGGAWVQAAVYLLQNHSAVGDVGPKGSDLLDFTAWTFNFKNLTLCFCDDGKIGHSSPPTHTHSHCPQKKKS